MNNLFYAEALDNLLSILGSKWHLYRFKMPSGINHFSLMYYSTTFAGGPSYYDVLENFIKCTKIDYFLKTIQNEIPIFLKVDSVEELLIQIDLHHY